MSEYVLNENVAPSSEGQDVLASGSGTVPAAARYVPPARRNFDLDGKDRRYVPFFAASSVLMVFWGICSGFRCGFTVSYIIMFLVMSLYLRDRERKLTPAMLVRGAACVLLSVPFSLSFTGIDFYAMLLLFAESVLFFDGLVRDRSETGDMGLLSNILRAFFPNAFGCAGTAVSSYLSGVSIKGRKTWPALKGVLLALPAAAVIIILLVEGDAAFEGLLSGLFINVPANAVKIVFGLILSVFVTAFAWGLKKNEVTERSGIRSLRDARTVTSFLAVIALIYTVYIISQSAYFFSAFSGILPEGYTFSVAEYARRGFFEMTVITAINFGIVFATASMTSDEDNSVPAPVKALDLFICVFTVMIAATALSKMVMYISVYGLTYKRVLTSVFMIGLLAVLFVLGIRIFRPGTKVLRAALSAAVIAVLLLSLGNVNGFIAKYNYDRYVSGSLKTIDVWHMYSLGDVGVEYLVLLSESEDLEIRSDAYDAMRTAVYSYWYVSYDSRYGMLLNDGKIHTKWYEKTVTSVKAEKILEERIAQNRDFLRDY